MSCLRLPTLSCPTYAAWSVRRATVTSRHGKPSTGRSIRACAAFFVRRVGMEHADDAVSETMTRAVASIGRFQWGEAGFDGWVFGIARHVSVDHHRRLDRVRRYRHVGRLFPGGKFDGSEPVDHDLVVGDDQALIRQLFATDPGRARGARVARVIAGLSAEQVGEVLGRKPGAVRTAQSRALTHLRELMEEYDG